LAKRHTVKLIEVSGSDSSIGERLGRSCRTTARQMLRDGQARWRARGVDWERNIANSLRYLPYAEDYSPRYMDMIRGYARGSGLRFEDVFAMIYEGETFGCTDIAVNEEATADGSVLSAHTEDWWTTYEDQLVLVNVRPKTGPSFLATSYGGLELLGGINSSGVSLTINSLTQNDMRVGVPRVLFAFEVLVSKTLGDALNACTPEDRASGYNYNICHKSGEMYCVEVSAMAHSLLYPSGGYMVHTNHYLHPKMARYEAIFDETVEPNRGYSTGSIVRCNRAWRLLENSLGEIDLETLFSIQKDHVNLPHSICCHAEAHAPKPLRWKTIFSVVYDLKKGSIWLGTGNPCDTTRVEYRLAK